MKNLATAMDTFAALAAGAVMVAILTALTLTVAGLVYEMLRP